MRRIGVALESRGFKVASVATEVATEVATSGWTKLRSCHFGLDEAEMASVVEEASVFVYGMSQAFKDSADCRKMAQYSYQCNVDMVPLKMEQGYRADGWLGILLGSALWFPFYGSVLESEAAFTDKVEELCRELGERGKM
jgi:hypothetical protein